MALSEFEAARLRKTVGAYVEKHRPPVHIRSRLDSGFRIIQQSVVLFEIRPVWQGEAGEKLERPYAKATWVKASGSWRVYWQRADLKWHRYEPFPTARSIEQFLQLVEADEHHCFHG